MFVMFAFQIATLSSNLSTFVGPFFPRPRTNVDKVLMIMGQTAKPELPMLLATAKDSNYVLLQASKNPALIRRGYWQHSQSSRRICMDCPRLRTAKWNSVWSGVQYHPPSRFSRRLALPSHCSTRKSCWSRPMPPGVRTRTPGWLSPGGLCDMFVRGKTGSGCMVNPLVCTKAEDSWSRYTTGLGASWSWYGIKIDSECEKVGITVPRYR